MGDGVEILKKKGIWKLYFTIYCINPKDARTTEGKFGYGRYYTSPSEENYIQALNRGLYHAVKLSQEMIERNPDWTIARISWGDKLNFLNKDGVALINDSIKVSIDDYTPTPEDLKRTYESEIIFESMDCCIWCGRKEGPYSDAKLVACKGCPELVCQYCNLEELGCKMCFKEDDLSFESPPVNYTNRDIIKKIKDEYYSDVPFKGFRRYSPKEEKLVSKFMEGYRMGKWEEWDEFIKTLDKEEEYVEEGYIEEDSRLMPYSDEDDLPDMTPYDEHLYIHGPFLDLYPDNHIEEMDWWNRMDDVYRDWGKTDRIAGIPYMCVNPATNRFFYKDGVEYIWDEEFPLDEEEIYDAEGHTKNNFWNDLNNALERMQNEAHHINQIQMPVGDPIWVADEVDVEMNIEQRIKYLPSTRDNYGFYEFAYNMKNKDLTSALKKQIPTIDFGLKNIERGIIRYYPRGTYDPNSSDTLYSYNWTVEAINKEGPIIEIIYPNDFWFSRQRNNVLIRPSIYWDESWGAEVEDEEFPLDEEEIYDAEMTKDGKDYVSRKIATIMRDWKKTGKIGNSSPKDSKTAQRQAIAVAFSMAARKGFKGTKKAEEDYFYFDELAKKHGIMSNKLLLGSLAVVLSIASIGNMMVKTAVNAKELVAEEDSEKGCGCGCKKKGGCN